MSAQFGRWNFDGRPMTPDYMERVAEALAPYGPDSLEKYSKEGLTIVYRAFHTTQESHREMQPHISASGALITWDGRLDNHKELISELRYSPDATDLAIVAAAYDQWGEQCLPKLIGDWALSIWIPNNRSLLLAKDPIGTRPLYYWYNETQVSWGTIFDPIVRLAGRTFELDKEYVAGLLSSYPAVHVTPCRGIYSVPPSSRVLIKPGKRDVRTYWDFDPGKKIRYRTDPEYEEHFRTVFAQAVQRKLRSDRPVLAELSGGRDSSSIVCMGDMVIANGHVDCPRLDTFSCYDDSEPNWNERPYFTKVEEKRGRTGWHVNFGCQTPEERVEPEPPSQVINNRFPTPGNDGRTSPDLRKCLTAQGNRVVLSGIGGDEVMGGVPTPVPELQNLIARGQIRALAHQLKVWALELRKPWIHLFWDAVRDFLPPALIGVEKQSQPPTWLQPGFVKRYRAALTGYPRRTKVFGSLPSFQGNTGTLDHVRKQLARSAPPFDPPFDKRYPFLDRDLLEFLFAIPREQLVRPTQRRSLMRRALAGIVPDEILNRKTKAFVSRAPLTAISRDWAFLMEVTQNMLSSSLGIVDRERLHLELQKGRAGEEIPIITVNSTLFVDGWLKNLQASGYVDLGAQKKTNLTWQASVQG